MLVVLIQDVMQPLSQKVRLDAIQLSKFSYLPHFQITNSRSIPDSFHSTNHMFFLSTIQQFIINVSENTKTFSLANFCGYTVHINFLRFIPVNTDLNHGRFINSYVKFCMVPIIYSTTIKQRSVSMQISSTKFKRDSISNIFKMKVQ